MSLRKAIKTRGAFPSKEAALKVMYLAQLQASSFVEGAALKQMRAKISEIEIADIGEVQITHAIVPGRCVQ